MIWIVRSASDQLRKWLCRAFTKPLIFTYGQLYTILTNKTAKGKKMAVNFECINFKKSKDQRQIDDGFS